MVSLLANWAQIVSVLPLGLAVVGAYFKHRCHYCRRVARFRVGEHQVPTCDKHRHDSP